MKFLFLSTLSFYTSWLLSCNFASADILYENELIEVNQVYDLALAISSDVGWSTENTTQYYCVFRSFWTKDRHPKDFPKLARWGNPVLFSHTKQYTPFLKDYAAPRGVEKIAESGFPDTFENDLKQAGNQVLDYVQGNGFTLDQNYWDNNYEYLPPIKISFDYPFLSGLAGMMPSPDWFTEFYLMDTVDDNTNVFWEHFKIRTYPWDAGTDDGTTYTAVDRDVDRLGSYVTRITTANSPDEGIFTSPDGSTVLPVAEWECLLNVCPEDNPECQKEDWPPNNGCDVLRYPDCTTQCNPQTDSPCEQCTPRSGIDTGKVYYPNCCQSGHTPLNGKCKSTDEEATSSAIGRYGSAMAVVAAFLSAAAMGTISFF